MGNQSSSRCKLYPYLMTHKTLIKQLKTKYLSSLKIPRPTSSSSTLGSLQTRSKTYNLVAAGQTHKVRQAVNSEGRVINAGPSVADVMTMDVDTLDQDDLRREGGEEMEGMTLMVPRFSRKGKLYAGMSASPLSPHLLPSRQYPSLLSAPCTHRHRCPSQYSMRIGIWILTISAKTTHPTPNPRTRTINNSRTIRQRHDININIKYPLIPLNRQNTSDHYSDTRKKGSTHPPPKIQE